MTSATDERPDRLLDRVLRFGRASLVGSGASFVDFSVLTTCIRLFGVTPTSARLPALLAGATFQFFGNRSYTFRAKHGSLSRQAQLFVGAECITLSLNWLTYRWLLPRVDVIPPEIVSFLGTFIVFICFAYPVRRLLIFKVPASG